MVYVPLNVWEEEGYYRQLRRDRMKNIAHAEEFFYELTGEYTTNINELFPLVEAAMDSLIADSLFTGEQVINLDGISYSVDMERGFETRVDTTFSSPTELYLTYEDTIFTVGLKNLESDGDLDVAIHQRHSANTVGYITIQVHHSKYTYFTRTVHPAKRISGSKRKIGTDFF